MAYTKKDWVNDEIITEAALDNMENGIAANDAKNTQQDSKIGNIEQKNTQQDQAISGLQQKTTKATTSQDGLMSKEDKAKLDAIQAQANKYVLTAASKTALGGVKQAAMVPEAVGEQVSKAEFKSLLDSLKAAGIMSNS